MGGGVRLDNSHNWKNEMQQSLMGWGVFNRDRGYSLYEHAAMHISVYTEAFCIHRIEYLNKNKRKKNRKKTIIICNSRRDRTRFIKQQKQGVPFVIKTKQQKVACQNPSHLFNALHQLQQFQSKLQNSLPQTNQTRLLLWKTTKRFRMYTRYNNLRSD